jgi:4-hydroxybenzoate polyprenyltransferase
VSLARRARRYLSCLRWGEILVLQGPPLLGAASALGAPTAHRLAALAVFAAANLLLVAHIFVLNDWAGVDADLNDANRLAGVFAARGISREAIGRLCIGLLALSLALFGILNLRTLALAAAIAALGFLYSRPGWPAKGVPVLGSALHLTGGLLHFLLGVSLFRAIARPDLALGLFFGLTFAAGHLNQEVRDFQGDAANRIRTNAVAFGKKPTFLAGLAGFTAAYALLAMLAAAGLLPAWLGLLALLLYPLHLQAARRALAAGLTYDAMRRLQARYRLLYAVIGAAMAAGLLLPAHPPRATSGAAPAAAMRSGHGGG